MAARASFHVLPRSSFDWWTISNSKGPSCCFFASLCGRSGLSAEAAAAGFAPGAGKANLLREPEASAPAAG